MGSSLMFICKQQLTKGSHLEGEPYVEKPQWDWLKEALKTVFSNEKPPVRITQGGQKLKGWRPPQVVWDKPSTTNFQQRRWSQKFVWDVILQCTQILRVHCFVDVMVFQGALMCTMYHEYNWRISWTISEDHLSSALRSWGYTAL